MSAHTTHTDAAHHEHGHDNNAPKVYIAVLVTLLFLTFITVGASYINFGSPIVNVIVALVIATVKASLVGLFFMHLLHDKPINAIIFVSGFAFFGLFLIACFQDIAQRVPVEPTNLKAAPAAPAGTPQSNPAMVNPSPASSGSH